MKNNLTILLTIFNRSEYTLRWINTYIDKSCPFQVFICDGGNDKNLEEKLTKLSERYEKITYQKFNYYENYNNFYEKFYFAVENIKTKYIYIAEDDDYLIYENIYNSIKFLDQNDDYVCSGGKNFEITPYNQNLFKKFLVISEENQKVFSSDDENVEERIKKMLQNIYSNYNCVFRRDAILEIFKNLYEKNNINLWVSELIFILHTCLIGKIKRFPHIEYIKIANVENSSSYNFFKSINLFKLITSKKFSIENYDILTLFNFKDFDENESKNIETLINNNLSMFWEKLIYEKFERDKLSKKFFYFFKNILKHLKIFDLIKFFSVYLNNDYSLNKNIYFVKKNQKEKISEIELKYFREILNANK